MKKPMLVLGIAVMVLQSSLLLPGCALLLIGGGAAGAIAISKDEIEGFVDNSFDRVWGTSRTVTGQQGIITVEDKARGFIQADIRKSKVELKLDRLNNNTVRLRIKARKMSNLFPNRGLAEELYTKIVKSV